MSDAAVQQPSPTKRGRGRGRGGATRGAASARARGKPATGRRGRAKVYETSRAQAAHERQRDLKNAYATLSAAMKPALEDLADRNLDRLRSQYNAHSEVDEYQDIIGFLDKRHQHRLSELNSKLHLALDCQHHEFNAHAEYTEQSFKNRCADKVEEYYDTLLRRLDILEQLAQNSEPFDASSPKSDDSYNYKPITTAEALEQGIYLKLYKGVEVPYPHLHPVLARDASKSKTYRTPNKRKPLNQLEDQSTPKRPVSVLDEKAGADIPRHIGGLLSAVAPDEPMSQPPSPSPVDDNDDAPTPPAGEPTAAGRGRKRKPLPREPSAEAEDTDAEEDDMLPPIPNGASDPDEYGVRLINKRARVNDMPNNRIMVPSLFEFEAHEIGFRDSTNDKSRGATKAKRQKFLNGPNSGAMFFDRNLCSYDATQYAEGELNQDTVSKHSLHPKYGLFLNQSANESEPPRPYESGWRPTVFVSDAGKILHTSRSVPKAKAEESYRKLNLKTMLKEFMEREGIAEEEIHDDETERLLAERDVKRRELEQRQDEAQAEQDEQLGSYNLALLARAAEASDSQVPIKAQQQSVSPVPSRPSTMSRPYDAIRDVFGGSGLTPAALSAAPATEDDAAASLLLLAGIALRDEEAASAEARVVGEPQQIQIQMPEPVRPRQLRDHLDLEQDDQPLVDYPDPENPFVPRQLAFPEYFIGRDPTYPVQRPQTHQGRTVPQSPLAQPESFYREPGGSYPQQQSRQPMQPPRPYLGQKGPPPALSGPESYPTGESEMAYGQPEVRRPSQLSQPSEEQYEPPRPNTEDVALLDPQLFEGGQRPGASQLQAPQYEQTKRQGSGGVLQQPQTSFFQTALNSPQTPTAQDQVQITDQVDASQGRHQFGPPLSHGSGPPPANEGSPGRTPFSNPNGADSQPLPSLRPLNRDSGPLVAPATGSQAPQHIMMTPGDPGEPYPSGPAPPPPAYMESTYPPNGYSPDQPIMSTEQGPRLGYMAQPAMHPSQQPPPPGYPAQQPYQAPGPTGSQPPPMFDNGSGPIVQSPPPYGNNGAISPSPGRSNSISSTSRSNKPYRELKPAPRSAEDWGNGGSELRMMTYNPYEGIRDYNATAPTPSHGPTQIRGWTHTTGSRKSRGKNSTDSQIDPSLGREAVEGEGVPKSVRIEDSAKKSREDVDGGDQEDGTRAKRIKTQPSRKRPRGDDDQEDGVSHKMGRILVSRKTAILGDNQGDKLTSKQARILASQQRARDENERQGFDQSALDERPQNKSRTRGRSFSGILLSNSEEDSRRTAAFSPSESLAATSAPSASRAATVASFEPCTTAPGTPESRTITLGQAGIFPVPTAQPETNSAILGPSDTGSVMPPIPNHRAANPSPSPARAVAATLPLPHSTSKMVKSRGGLAFGSKFKPANRGEFFSAGFGPANRGGQNCARSSRRANRGDSSPDLASTAEEELKHPPKGGASPDTTTESKSSTPNKGATPPSRHARKRGRGRMVIAKPTRSKYILRSGSKTVKQEDGQTE